MDKIEKELSTLAWTKADFVSNNEEIPESMTEDDLHTEGELMTIEEIAEWIQDTEKVLYVILQEDADSFEKLYDKYFIDIHYLAELGKINSNESAKLLDKKRFFV
jgi:hypothetical protein